MTKFFAFALILVGLGGAALWYVAYQLQLPDLTQAQTTAPSMSVSTDAIQNEVKRIDQQIAAQIRKVGEEGIDFSMFSQVPQVASSFQQASQATLSATVSTTPEELWQTLREEGAQAVMGSLAKNAEVSVNDLSTDIMNEARYQYCVGVVEQYEHNRSAEDAAQ
ncbi:hypothetical protein LRY65_04520 [Candidatus Woesebacteria bacterium]|nr:hypothetical protein [Candidatus Woesebacteria bacterium]MCD8507594.1 hypothetical protein [Candidatus Woesebacteria bacterium]MCD8527437.1 hypothetical protein [Candidatus Woesebacteria bacterium]MCD8546180.1 hypothetical protein [Candidatus Woesebacteria bacterium]